MFPILTGDALATDEELDAVIDWVRHDRLPFSFASCCRWAGWDEPERRRAIWIEIGQGTRRIRQAA